LRTHLSGVLMPPPASSLSLSLVYSAGGISSLPRAGAAGAGTGTAEEVRPAMW
jgi:hypothetical protein